MERALEDIGQTAERVFNKEAKETRHKEVPDPARLDGFAGSCAPKGWSRRELVLLVGFFVGAPGVLVTERDTAAAEAEQEAVTLHEKQEVDVERQAVERLQSIFDDAAGRLQTKQSIGKTFSPEQVRAMTEAVRTFPVEQALQVLAEESGISVNDLAAMNELKVVQLYTDDDIHQMVDQIASSELREKRTDDLNRLGLNLGGEGIFVNVSKVVDDQADPQQLTAEIADVLMHEFIHSWAGNEAFQVNERWRLFYEGMTEAIANRVGARLHGEGGAYDPVPGYLSGSTALAELVLSSTDSQEVIRGFLQGQPAAVAKAFDAQFVDGAFQSTLFDGSATPRETEPPYKYIAPLSKMVELLGAEAPSTVARANAHLATSKIHLYQSADFHGVFLVSDKAETGIANGLVTIEGSEAVAIFPSNTLEGVTMSKLDNDAFYVFEDLHAYGPTASVDAASEVDVDSMISQMVVSRSAEMRLNAKI